MVYKQVFFSNAVIAATPAGDNCHAVDVDDDDAVEFVEKLLA